MFATKVTTRLKDPNYSYADGTVVKKPKLTLSTGAWIGLILTVGALGTALYLVAKSYKTT